MPKQRIYVNVVGFSDVERHALNTVFRLSEDRELSYAPWVPLTAPGVGTTVMNAHVSLVDGESAEAVLIHARELPAGQRLIWVGLDAPAHAWRVLRRPIRWSAVLDDLDAVYAARQADSGFLDLDITSPSPLETGASGTSKRALLVGLGPKEVLVLRERLAQVGVSEVEVAQSNELALEGIGGRRFVCGVFNLDDHHIDVWSLAGLFAQRNPSALTLGISEHAGPLSSWWNRRRIKRDTARTGIQAVVSLPLHARDLQPWLGLLL
jgi:hypothetical protein